MSESESSGFKYVIELTGAAVRCPGVSNLEEMCARYFRRRNQRKSGESSAEVINRLFADGGSGVSCDAGRLYLADILEDTLSESLPVGVLEDKEPGILIFCVDPRFQLIDQPMRVTIESRIHQMAALSVHWLDQPASVERALCLALETLSGGSYKHATIIAAGSVSGCKGEVALAAVSMSRALSQMQGLREGDRSGAFNHPDSAIRQRFCRIAFPASWLASMEELASGPLDVTAIWRDAGVEPHSISLVVRAHQPVAPDGEDGEPLLRALAEAGHPSGLFSRNRPWCALADASMEAQGPFADVAAVVVAALALHHRVLPSSSRDLNYEESSPFYSSTVSRPWINPGSPFEPREPRRAAVMFADRPAAGGFLIVEEIGDSDEAMDQCYLPQDSELIVVDGTSPSDIERQLYELQQWCLSGQAEGMDDFEDLEALAMALNLEHKRSHYGERSGLGDRYRLSIVAHNRPDLGGKVALALSRLRAAPKDAFDRSVKEFRGIFYTGRPSDRQGKLGFIYPGLGAAYPDMLSDLCFHFPEVRQVFDYVDRLALKAGDQHLPSRLVFPLPDRNPWGESSLSGLAMMDSAVVTVLLAEYALSTLLRRLGVVPDAILGVSTGEFAALTTNGSVDILRAAETFYRLSTAVSRSVSRPELSSLRSIQVAASLERLRPLLDLLEGAVFVSADMTRESILLSGKKEAMGSLVEWLNRDGIEFLQLPVAIPYHTPLVRGKVSAQEREVRELQVVAPKIPSWSCSTGDRYPEDPELLKRLSTELFEKPILFRSTIEHMHLSGVSVFVEVGPRGSLADQARQVLQNRGCQSLAANRPGVSALTQLHYLLAELTCWGADIDFEFLYQRRFRKHNVRSWRRLRAAGARLSSDGGAGHEPEWGPIEPRSETSESPVTDSPWAEVPSERTQDTLPETACVDPHSPCELAPAPDLLVSSYLEAMREVYRAAARVQENVLVAYLQEYQECSPPFLCDAVRLPEASGCGFALNLSLDDFPFLRDHAVGGVISRETGERVYLLPLMAALEIMAEAAVAVLESDVLEGELQVLELKDVRAYRRVRVGGKPMALLVMVSRREDGVAYVELRRQADRDTEPCMSCHVVCGQRYPDSPKGVVGPRQRWERPRLDRRSLYGPGAMFHGPSMQSVESLGAVSSRSLAGMISGRGESGWFRRSSGSTLVEPRLLDNASQLVFFCLLEQKLPVVALLPFHIERVRRFGYPGEKEEYALAGQARLMSLTERGTVASVEVHAGDSTAHPLLVSLEGISSRSIVLNDHWTRLVSSPVSVFLSKELGFSGIGSEGWTATVISEEALPVCDVTLDWCTDYVLTPAEQAEWRALPTPKRAKEWLLGRLAAKDAVRLLVKRATGVTLCPVDVGVRRAESGIPEVLPGLHSQLLGYLPRVSISHSDGVATAVACSASLQPGVDVETVKEREHGFAELAFRASERAIIESSIRQLSREALHTVLWAAKEAAVKACGGGAIRSARELEVRELDPSGGRVGVYVKSLGTVVEVSVQSIAPERIAALCFLYNEDCFASCAGGTTL